MRIASLSFTPVSVPYSRREESVKVDRDGVTDVVVKITTDDGMVGWGESCSGPNVESIIEALNSFKPFLLGADPWNRDALWYDCYVRGIWLLREPTFNFAWAGIDMALWDICGKTAGQPLYRLLGGLRRKTVNYFYYLPTRDLMLIEDECRKGVREGYSVFYIKTGQDLVGEESAIELIRRIIGPDRKIRIDCNEAWTVSEAIRNLELLDRWHLDFAEQPVPAEPIENMLELKRRTRVPLSANESANGRANAWKVIKKRACDVLCFSEYFVGTIGEFHRLGHAAAAEGLSVCLGIHGELGIAAAAHQHVLLNLPRVVEGNQKVANLLVDDIVTHQIPIATQPSWGVIEGAGLGIEVDQEQLEKYHQHYLRHGQYLPYELQKVLASRL